MLTLYIYIIPALLCYGSNIKITFTAAWQEGKELVNGNIDFVLGSLRTSTNLSKVFQQFINTQILSSNANVTLAD
jgi:hypothetical protein